MREVKLFTPRDNENSNWQIGTEMLRFGEKPNQPWLLSPPYAKYGYGYYDPLNEFRNQGLFGVEELPDSDPEISKALKITTFSVPIAFGSLAAGLAYGLYSGSIFKSTLIGAVAGSIPLGLSLINLKMSVK